jgi:hypothetical protein
VLAQDNVSIHRLVSGSWHYTNPTKHVDLVIQSGPHHHLIEN